MTPGCGYSPVGTVGESDHTAGMIFAEMFGSISVKSTRIRDPTKAGGNAFLTRGVRFRPLLQKPAPEQRCLETAANRRSAGNSPYDHDFPCGGYGLLRFQ